ITVSQYQKGQAPKNVDIQPIYSIKGDITPFRLKKTIDQGLEQFASEIEELLPDHYLDSYRLPVRVDAVRTMHQPENRQSLKHARRRFVYEELLLFQLKMQLLRKWARENSVGNIQNYDVEKVNSFVKQLPFSLTDAQERSLHEILQDMKSPFRMNRLLQGDVGSGKTAVAAICLFASITSKKQGALMVPT